MSDGMAAPASVLREVPRTAAPTLLSAAPRRPIVMVLGMHRSGTSLCSHVLSALGLDMSDDLDVNPTNPKGHWERMEIVALHERILRLFNQSFDSPLHDFALPAAWWAQPQVAQVRREINGFLERRIGQTSFGFKDPRTVRLMPMWHQIMSDLKLAPKIVYCLRNPAQVARSLQGRDGLTIEMGEYRWLTYNIDFFHYTKAAEFCTIEYESWFEEPQTNLTKLRRFLSISEDSEFDLDPAIAGIIDDELRHDDFPRGDARQPLIRSVYKLMRRAEHDPAARDQLRGIAAQFQTFQQLQTGLRREFERAAADAAKLSAAKEAGAALCASLGERDAQIATVRDEAEANALRATEAAAEIERQQAQIADLVRERDGMAGVLAAARAGLDAAAAARVESEGRLSDLEERLGSRTAAAEAMRAELAGLRETLLTAERRAEQGEAAAAESQSEMAGLRNALAETERQAAERVEAAATIESAVAEARAALVEAVHAAEQRTAAVVAMESEFATLQTSQAAAEAEIGQLQGKIASLHDALSETERQVGDRESAAAALQAEIAVLRAALNEAERRAQEAEAIPQIRAELDQLSDALARAEQEAWERSGLTERMRVELLSLNAELARIRHDARERVAVIGSMEAELSGLREALPASERDAPRREGVAIGRRSEIATVDGAIERGEQGDETHAAEITRLDGEITRLRETVTRALHDAEQRAAGAKSLQGELAAAQSALAAARQVGRAAINALATDNPAPLERMPRLGWRQAVRQLFGLIASA